jgi:multiple sugar transport system ATP-binding protein
MNFIAGSASGTGASGLFSFEGGSLALPCPAQGKVTLGQRPEHIHLTDDATWRGQVTLVEPTGADTYVVVKTGVGLITVRTPPSTQVQVGDQVGLSVSSNHNNWFDAQTGLRLG